MLYEYSAGLSVDLGGVVASEEGSVVPAEGSVAGASVLDAAGWVSVLWDVSVPQAANESSITMARRRAIIFSIFISSLYYLIPH